ncbi:hypothetical protein HYALB_00001479 [Hymenoscyphus albidus]|uniref:Alpha/beta-hydrolase n=1 Tax=Hymenoscyphus albidus TaxID=595503 RepID=A0A9N9Q1F1_9HELO|nr:hypothetical protein HYALB_00001479 [Hymenoscyphus albidus]
MLATNASASGDRHILTNPGGPGGSGVEFLGRAAASLNKVIGENFHLLSFDPRGVSGSIPRAICYPSDTLRAESFIDAPWNLEFQAVRPFQKTKKKKKQVDSERIGKMYTKAENKAKACEDEMGEYGGYINTPQTAADINSILDALGQEKMYYWGFSYGTTLGQTYAQMFPSRVERLIIDGVSNLDEWYNEFFFEESLVDTDKSYAGFAEECFKAKEACPLNSLKDMPFESSSELKSFIDSFLADLQEVPIPVYLNASNYGSITRRKIVTNGIFFSLYKPFPFWVILAENLAALFNGNSKPVYNAYSDNWIAGVLSDETNDFVTKNDNWLTGAQAPVHGVKPVQNYTIAKHPLSTLVSKYYGSDAYDRASWLFPTTHKFHPQYHPQFPRVKTAKPILVLSTTFDPVCPLASAKKAQNSFEGAGFVEQKSYGHCSISMPSLCTAKHVHRYFNEGTIPEAGSTCKIDADYFPGRGKSHVSTLSEEDRELLAALSDLAAEDVIPAFLPSRMFGV